MKLKVVVEIELDEDIIREKRTNGYSGSMITGEISSHLHSAIGNKAILNYEYIGDFNVKSIEVMPVQYLCSGANKCDTLGCPHKKPHQLFCNCEMLCFCNSIGKQVKCEEIK